MTCPHCAAVVSSLARSCPACGTLLRAHLEPDTLLGGRYLLAQAIGQGGFGITYYATDTLLERHVAIKELFPEGAGRSETQVIPPTALADTFSEARAQFLAEARTLAKFTHPAIVRVHDVVEENATAYLVMEHLEGISLAERLREGRLEPDEVTALAETLLEALAALHARGLLHRDIKPDNIILNHDGRAVLIDFGSARAFADETTTLTRLVTPGYAAPEQYAQAARFGAYTDLYGLGATLYHALVGSPPPAATDRLIGTELPPLPDDTPPNLRRAIERALELRVDERPANAEGMLELLFPTQYAPPEPELIPPPPPQRRGLLLPLLLLVIASVAGVALWYAPRPEDFTQHLPPMLRNRLNPPLPPLAPTEPTTIVPITPGGVAPSVTPIMPGGAASPVLGETEATTIVPITPGGVTSGVTSIVPGEGVPAMPAETEITPAPAEAEASTEGITTAFVPTFVEVVSQDGLIVRNVPEGGVPYTSLRFSNRVEVLSIDETSGWYEVETAVGSGWISPEWAYPVVDETEMAEFLETLESGGELLLREGLYRLETPLTLTQNITLRGAGREKTYILSEGADYTLQISGARFHAENITFLYRGNAPGNVLVAEDSMVDLRSSRLSGAVLFPNRIGEGAGLVLRGNSSGSIVDSDIGENGATGITVAGSSTVRLERNHIHNNRNSGVAFLGESSGVLQANLIEGNGGYGVMLLERARPTLGANTLRENAQGEVGGFNTIR